MLLFCLSEIDIQGFIVELPLHVARLIHANAVHKSPPPPSFKTRTHGSDFY